MENKLEKRFYCSPLRYPGGKTSLVPFLDKVIKKNNLHDGIYIEPFAGGGGAALSLLLMEKVERIVINDLDRAIYAFWNSVIMHPEKFIRKINNIKITINEWKQQKRVYHNPNSSDFDLGFASFFLNRTNHSGIIEGGPIGGIKQDGKWKINARFNKDKLSDRIEKIALYRKRIQIFNRDGLHLFLKYKNTKKVLFYLDPPYYVKGSCLYLNHYVDKNHSDLAQVLNGNNDLKWLLTYDNVNFIHKLYPERRQINYLLNYSAHKPSKGKEIMIFSDALLLPSEDIN